MRQKPTRRPSSSEQIIRDIRRKTRKQYSIGQVPNGSYKVTASLVDAAFTPSSSRQIGSKITAQRPGVGDQLRR